MFSEKSKDENLTEFIVTLLRRAKLEKEKHKNVENVPWDSINQLSKTTWLLGIFQITLIILFATLAGEIYSFLTYKLTLWL